VLASRFELVAAAVANPRQAVQHPRVLDGSREDVMRWAAHDLAWFPEQVRQIGAGFLRLPQYRLAIIEEQSLDLTRLCRYGPRQALGAILECGSVRVGLEGTHHPVDDALDEASEHRAFARWRAQSHLNGERLVRVPPR
jgi:hypothetical protein